MIFVVTRICASAQIGPHFRGDFDTTLIRDDQQSVQKLDNIDHSARGMLLNQFKTGTAAWTLCGSRDGFVLGKARSMGQKKSLQARANARSEGGGWLSSKIGKVTNYVDTKLHGQASKDGASEVLKYKGTAVLMKKLAMLNLLDRYADAQDDVSDSLRGKKVTVQLMSNEIDPNTGKALISSEVNIDGWTRIFDPLTAEPISFNLEFAVPKTFGVPGAIIVRNNHPNEFLFVSFTLDLSNKSNAHYLTNSWVYNTQSSEPRVFFHNKAYLPTDTPAALKELRERELQETRGDGTGERKVSDRIYDYDTYNDLGEPDKDPKLTRPTLGGYAEFPFPRRMRTGRPPSKANPEFESRTKENPYVPSDERYDYIKLSDNKADIYRAGIKAASTIVKSKLAFKNSFESIEEVKKMYAPKGKYNEGINNVLPNKADVPTGDQRPLVFLRELTSPTATGDKNDIFHFPLPQLLQVDERAWQKNTEFAREYLAGFHPIQIELVTEFPLKSSLSEAEYGDPTSAISKKHVDGHLEGLSIEQALSQKKLFVVDYHDAFLPWLERINKLEDSAQYASRVLFFLSSDETLKVLAIELVLPPKTPGGSKISRVFTPPTDPSKTDYVFELAKAHATSNDMATHQSISHFTRCHAVTEPMIIATNRQLSKLHPIYQLMAPHCRHTLEVNGTARLNLLPAKGTIEQIYTPREYVVRMAAAYYRDSWTFEGHSLPNDLVNRGMAVPDSSAKHGVKLVVEDYPYAADGLELWSAMKSWNTEYIDIYYKDDSDIQKDIELQNWYTEYRTVGHGDKKDAPGWPVLNSKKNLAEILTILQWIPTAMHAPINFGQFDYAAFMPYRPSITRRFIPEEGTQEWKELHDNPEKFYLSSVTDTTNTNIAMAVFEVVASHAENEEYIYERTSTWTGNEKAQAAFKRYSEKLIQIDELIQARNKDKNLKNRCGPAQMPFQLLRPVSAPGVTGMGIPNSITV